MIAIAFHLTLDCRYIFSNDKNGHTACKNSVALCMNPLYCTSSKVLVGLHNDRPFIGLRQVSNTLSK